METYRAPYVTIFYDFNNNEIIICNNRHTAYKKFIVDDLLYIINTFKYGEYETDTHRMIRSGVYAPKLLEYNEIEWNKYIIFIYDYK